MELPLKIGLLICFVIKFSDGARILGIFTVPSISHQIVYHGLTKELARRGHELIVMTPDVDKDPTVPSERYQQIDVHDLSYNIFRDSFKFGALKLNPTTAVDVYNELIKSFQKIFDAQLSSPQVQDKLFKNESQKFDLVIAECYLPATFAFAAKYGVPYISICSTNSVLSGFDGIGNPVHPLLYPELFAHRVGKLNLLDKIYRVYSYLLVRSYDINLERGSNDLIQKHFGAGMPSSLELENNVDMLFVNVFPILTGIRPAVPALLYLGGLHLKPRKPLPQDLQKYLDESTQGVVYMSLGTNVHSVDLASETLNMLMEVFARLSYNVLWKFESDELPGKPSNVRIEKWLPQQDLLQHKNLKAFITQGGQQSMDEAIRDEVPLIGIPFFADQHVNVQKIVIHGIGIALHIETLTADTLLDAIESVTKDKKFKNNIKKLKDVLYDQPMSPLDRAVWWTEYVLRHKGAKHLRSPSADVTLIEYFMLDIILVISLAILIPLTCIVLMIRTLYFRCFSDRKKKKDKSQ